MATLTLSMDGLFLREFALDAPVFRIGRHEHNDLQIDSPRVAGEHARLSAQPDGLWLEQIDEGQTCVNGQRVDRVRLHSGDLIGIGRYSLVYRDKQVLSPVSPVSGVLVIRSGPNAGKELALNKPKTTLGKAGEQAAVILQTPAGYVLNGATGGDSLRLNGVAVQSPPQLLSPGDVIEIAGISMDFVLKE